MGMLLTMAESPPMESGMCCYVELWMCGYVFMYAPMRVDCVAKLSYDGG